MGNTDLTAAVIFGAASLQGLLCALFFVFTKKGTRYANYFMLAMVISITLIVLQNFMIFYGAYVDFPKLIFLFYPLNGLVPPLFFMYVTYMLAPNRKMKFYDPLHLIIFLIMAFSHIRFFNLPDDIKISIVNYLYYEKTKVNVAELPLIIFYKLIALGYGVACFYLILKKIKELKQWTSNTHIQYLNKFKLINYMFIAYILLFIIIYCYPLWIEITVGRYEVYIHILNSVLIVAISIITMQQPDRLVFLLIKATKPQIKNKEDFLMFENLSEVMQTQKPYLNPDLKIHDLAKLINAPSHLLSEYINKKLNINFFEFINQYRVNEFKVRVHCQEYEKFTLFAIALDVGFNSKASFNRIFKQQTQMTPSQYKKKGSITKVGTSVC